MMILWSSKVRRNFAIKRSRARIFGYAALADEEDSLFLRY